MTQDEKKEYLERWGNKCYLCEGEMEPEDMALIEAIVEVKVQHECEEPFLTRYYVACPACAGDKVLL